MMSTNVNKLVDIVIQSMEKKDTLGLVSMKRFLIMNGYTTVHLPISKRTEYLFVIDYERSTSAIKINIYKVQSINGMDTPNMTVRCQWVNRYNSKTLGYWAEEPHMDYLFHISQIIAHNIIEENNKREGI